MCGGTGDDAGTPCTNCSSTGTVSNTITCSNCEGTGNATETSTCSNCEGSGKVDVNCSDCSGTGKTTETCSRCAGKGKILTENDDTFTFGTSAPSAIKVGDDLENAAKSEKNTTGEITYKSSDETIATVDANGKVTAHKAGTVRITASIKTNYVYSSKDIEAFLAQKQATRLNTQQMVPIIQIAFLKLQR